MTEQPGEAVGWEDQGWVMDGQGRGREGLSGAELQGAARSPWGRPPHLHPGAHISPSHWLTRSSWFWPDSGWGVPEIS